jgi:hypothetical protein
MKAFVEKQMSCQETCYGNLFPDLNQLDVNKTIKGRAFAVLVESKGIGVSARTVSVDRKAWEQCIACEDYRSCYDLSIAKLLLTHVVETRT